MINQYSQYKKQSVKTMTPVEIVIKLYSEIERQLAIAVKCVEDKDFKKSNAAFLKAEDCIDALREALDMSVPISANLEALSKLNWSTAEYKKISDQMSHLKEVPIIPASYAVTRNVYNAFRAVVNNQKNPRYQLSAYNRDINSEIVRKLKELGYYEEA